MSDRLRSERAAAQIRLVTTFNANERAILKQRIAEIDRELREIAKQEASVRRGQPRTP